MKNLLFIIFVLFLSFNLQSQTVKEIKFATSTNTENPQYDIQYDKLTGSYLYSEYDTTIKKSKFISNKGNSGYYDNCNGYFAAFNSKGDYFGISNTYAEDYRNDKSHLISNGKELATYDYIDRLTIVNDILYFVARKNEKSLLVKVNTTTKEFTNGKEYNEILLLNLKQVLTHEPEFELGFSKDGKEFYIAKDNDKMFLVIGGIEQEKFDEISPFNVTFDRKEEISYVATNYAVDGNESFVIQGSKRYNTFPAINELKFTKDNIPVYGISEDPENSYYTKTYVKGNTPGKYHNAGVYGLNYTPDGKLYYIATDSTEDGKYSSRLVIESVEGKPYGVIYNVKFTEDGKQLFITTRNDKEVLIFDGKEISGDYSYIFGLSISPNNKIGFVAMTYGNKELGTEDSYDVYADGKKFGPYKNVPYGSMEGYFETITFNSDDEYAFSASESNPADKENEYFRIISNKFNNLGLYDYISDLASYEEDFYYMTSESKGNFVFNYYIYKNAKKITFPYQAILNYVLNKEEGFISFIGFRNGSYYFITIEL